MQNIVLSDLLLNNNYKKIIINYSKLVISIKVYNFTIYLNFNKIILINNTSKKKNFLKLSI
jgi:hypothetical protein